MGEKKRTRERHGGHDEKSAASAASHVERWTR